MLDQYKLDDVQMDDPNWTIKQAHIAGQRLMISKIKDLVNARDE